MATRQSSLLCAPPGLLLLLIGVISSHLLVQAKPLDFWCNVNNREMMAERIEAMKVTTECMRFPPVQLPCVSVNSAEWANKTLQQKHAEVVENFWMFHKAVEKVMNQNTSQCQDALKDLKHHIWNYIVIIELLQIQSDTVTQSHSAVQNCSRETSPNNLLEDYKNLIKGKLERFVTDVQDR